MIQVGRLHAAQGNSDVAVVALRQAVALEPGKAAFWSILGVEVAKAGNWCQAQHCLVRSSLGQKNKILEFFSAIAGHVQGG